MRVCVVELFKVRVVGQEKRILGRKNYVFSEQSKAYEWLVGLPMDASDIDYYFKTDMVEVDNTEVGEYSLVTDFMKELDELKGARRVKDLYLIIRGLSK